MLQRLFACLLSLHEQRFFGLIALFCAAMLSVGWVLQYGLGLVPCPLCIIQRFFFGGVGLVAFLGWLSGRRARLFLGGMLGLALFGGLVAGRNVYIEHVPRGLDAQCIPWMKTVTDWIAVVFQAGGDCARRDWTLLGLSIPEWSLFAFAMLTGAIVWRLMRRTQVSSAAAPALN